MAYIYSEQQFSKMLKKMSDLWKDELIRGGFILFIMINLFNFLNYVFHFAMAHMLSPADYGIIVVLMSFAYIFGVPVEAIQAIISKYTTKFSDKGKIKDVILRGLKRAAKISFFLYLIFIPVAVFFAYFLKIKFLLLAITGLILISSFINPVLRGALQGKKRFNSLGASLNLESIIKLVLAIILVYFINNAYSAISAVVIASFIAFFITFIFIKDIMLEKRKNAPVKEIYSYSRSSFILFLVIMLMLSIDTILAKRFFPADLAGKYAVASIIGKMIFFGTMGISKAMFPISSEKKVKKDQRDVLKKAFALTIISIIIALAIFVTIPGLFVKILFGGKYVEIAGLLVYTGIAFSFLAVSNLVVMYKLSKGNVKSSSFMVVFAAIEVLLLVILSQNLFRFVIALCLSNLFMLIGSLFLKNK